MGSMIEWTDETWNPVRGCSRVSEGCCNCYAERMAARFADRWEGPPNLYGDTPDSDTRFATMTEAGPRWTGRVQLIPEKLDEPLHWRKPRRVFVNSMSDLFHERLPDSAIDKVFAVMALAPEHTYQILTKRPQRMRDYLTAEFVANRIIGAMQRIAPERGVWVWPGWDEAFRNVWLGVSVEDQITADERIPLLLQTPAALHFVSLEPLLFPVHLAWEWLMGPNALGWVIVGGESGPGARPFDVASVRLVVRQCREAGTACFVKQLGRAWARLHSHLGDQKGADPSYWPQELRVREFPR